MVYYVSIKGQGKMEDWERGEGQILGRIKKRQTEGGQSGQ